MPARALWLQALWASVLVLSGTYTQLLKYVVSADIVLYALMVFAVIVLRRKRPYWPRPVSRARHIRGFRSRTAPPPWL